MQAPEDEPIVTIRGDRVTLGPVSRDVLPRMARWMNDLGAQQRLGFTQPGPFTLEAEERWYEGVATATDQVTFLIRERASGAPIGSTGLHAIDHRRRSATFGILIGEPTARGRGFGTESTRLLLDFAFSVAGLHSVDLTVAEFNLAGQRAYTRAGFRECGRFRERIWMFGRWWDEIHMDCLDREFTSPVLAQAFGPDLPA